MLFSDSFSTLLNSSNLTPIKAETGSILYALLDGSRASRGPRVPPSDTLALATQPSQINLRTFRHQDLEIKISQMNGVRFAGCAHLEKWLWKRASEMGRSKLDL
jgi:hypothetical protein